MNILQQAWQYLKQFPDFLPAAQAALAVLIIAVPIYLGLWYFLHRRQQVFPGRLQFGILGVFGMFAGLAFLFASPWADQLQTMLKTYLLVTCVIAAYCIVSLLDIFFIDYYLIRVKKVYISPPLHRIISCAVFVLSLLPILRYVLNFDPLTLVAIPTIITAGIALAFQDTLKAFIAGVSLGRVIRVGDWVVIQGKEGRVVDITIARAEVRTAEGALLYIPNRLFQSEPFTNFTAERVHRLALKIGVACTAPPERVKETLLGCLEGLSGIAAFPRPAAQIVNWAEACIDYGLFYWIEDYDQRFAIQDALATRVWEAFRREGFELPVPFPTFTIDEGFHPLTREAQHFNNKLSAQSSKKSTQRSERSLSSES